MPKHILGGGFVDYDTNTCISLILQNINLNSTKPPPKIFFGISWNDKFQAMYWGGDLKIYSILSLGFGFFSSCWALTPILLVNDLGLDNLSQAMGYMMIFKGSLFLGPPLGGVIYDATESYDIAFFMAGSVYAIATFFSVIAACLEMRKKKKSKKDLNEVETGGEMVGTLHSISALFIAFAALAEIKKDMKESTKKYLPGDENEVTHLWNEKIIILSIIFFV